MLFGTCLSMLNTMHVNNDGSWIKKRDQKHAMKLHNILILIFHFQF